MESKNIQNESNEISNMQKVKIFDFNNFYVNMKSNFNLLIENNINPIFNMLNDNGYGKLLTAIIVFFSIVFGHVTIGLLITLYFISCSVNSVRAIKNNEDLNPIVNNWITYSAVILILYIIDILSYLTGGIIKIVFEVFKFMLLFCLYGSVSTKDNLNYGMSRIYSCNNIVIDTIQNGMYKLLNHAHQSYKKENYNKIIKSLSKEK